MVAHQTVLDAWNGRINDDLVDFDEYCAITNFMTESVEAQL